VGTYLLTNNYIVLITKSSDKLFLQRCENRDKLSPKTELLAYDKNKFWLTNKKYRFVFNTNQEVQTMTVYYNETSNIAKRIK
jgi:hypothetical protein